ncbi:MAG: histidine phosphatase family protein [Cyclobacteriaceae bacterium]
MLTLYLIRHAKSSWAFDLPDHDRPLGKRGRKDVLKMGRYLSEHHSKPEVLISSTASRAFYTALYICDQFGIDEGQIRLTKELFHAGSNEILNVIRSAPRSSSLAIFGHNPGLTDCANRLCGSEIENVPTCGVVGITFNLDHWKDVSFGSGRQEFFMSPKGV